MTETLEEMRQAYTGFQADISRLEQSIENAKRDAKTLADQAAGLTQDEAAQSLADLEAVNQRYLGFKHSLETTQECLETTIRHIHEHYDRALKGEAELDWSITVVPGNRWHGWGSQMEPKTHAICDKFLVAPELVKLKQFGRLQFLRLAEQGDGTYRLHGEYYAYRETCQTDYIGKDILERLAKLWQDRITPGGLADQYEVLRDK